MQWSYVYLPRRLTHLTAWPTGVPTNLLSEFRLYDWRSIFPDISLFYSISLDVSRQISSPQYKPELDYIKQIKNRESDAVLMWVGYMFTCSIIGAWTRNTQYFFQCTTKFNLSLWYTKRVKTTNTSPRVKTKRCTAIF